VDWGPHRPRTALARAGHPARASNAVEICPRYERRYGMHTQWMHAQWWKRVADGGVWVAGLTLCSTAFAAMPDAWITSKAKLALMTADGVSSTDVNVDTVDGHVTLHGAVGSAPEKTTAEQVVRKVEGVKDVRNMLQVVAPAQQAKVEAADEQIKDNVQQALKADKSLSDSSISVSSVNKGVVVLIGKAASLTDHLNAVADARAVPGVKQVASEIQSPDKLSDAEVWRETKGRAADAPDGSVTGAMSDMWITTAAKVRLIANDQTPATAINIDTHNGAVTLFGIVPTAAAKSAAEAEVKTIEGVKSVRNELQVVPPSAKDTVEASDEQIRENIAKKLDKSTIDDSDIQVEVKGGVVRLTGQVGRQTDRLRALTMARATDGVRSVMDEIVVRVQ
jgi:hyperosmotically inducible protein